MRVKLVQGRSIPWTPEAVMSWAYRLMADGHLPEAIDVVKLAVQIGPSSRAYSGLAEAYMKSGQEKEAIMRGLSKKTQGTASSSRCLNH